MKLINRFVYRTLALLCLTAVFSVPFVAPTRAQTGLPSLFGQRPDTLYMRMGETMRIWGDAGTSDSIYLYRWSTGDTTPYTDIADKRQREQWVWCQRVSALGWDEMEEPTARDTLLEPVPGSGEGDEDEDDDDHNGGHHKTAPAPEFAATVDTFSYNIFHVEEDSIWVGLSDVVCLTAGLDTANYPEDAGRVLANLRWHYGYPQTDLLSRDSVLYLSYDGKSYVTKVSVDRTVFIIPEGSHDHWGIPDDETQYKDIWIFWGVSPSPKVETDSVLVIFPQYARSDLGGDTLICLSYTDTLPAATDTILIYNLGPANRDLYVSYQWLWADTMAGEDSVFYCTFDMLDTVKENVYQGRLLVRVAVDTVVYDTVREFCDTCFTYDTVNIKVIRSVYPEGGNVFLPYDTLLCAHLDMTLRMTDTDYRAWWLDKDSVVMPYGDTSEFTFYGVRGVDSVGGGTDTREKVRYYLKYEHWICPWVGFDTLDVINLVQPQVALPFHDTMICREVPIEVSTWHNLVYMPAYAYDWAGEANETGTGECDFGDVSEVSIALGGDYIVKFFHRPKFDVCGYDTAYDTIRILWVDPVMTDILLPGDTGMCPNLYIVLDAKNDFDSTVYEWRLNPPPEPEDLELGNATDSVISFKPKIRVEEELSLYLTLTDTMQCSNTQEIKIHIEDCTPKIEIPNVFTPNGDGFNDIWRFKVLEKCTDVEIQVVNRWGVPVLKEKVADAQSFEWNGCLNSTGRPLPDGPYFYMVSYKDMYGKKRVQSGSVSIIGSSDN